MCDREVDSSKILRSVEVRGLKGVSLAYIQRFFGHAGPVEEVKKSQDIVLVRFKNQSSVNKALKFNGRVIDKQPIKIRSAGFLPQNKGQKQKKEVRITSLNSKKVQQKGIEDLDEAIRSQKFDLLYLWSNILRIINKLDDDRIIWLLHEIFFIKLTQIIHFKLYGTNSRSNYYQITLKQTFLGENKNKARMVQNQSNLQKLQILSIPTNQLQDEANFQCFLSNVDNRLKIKFQQLFNSHQGSRIYQLYNLFNTYSLIIPEEQLLLILQPSANAFMENSLSKHSITKQIINQSHMQISFENPKLNNKRSEYRLIDKNNPIKQIEVFSDSCLNDNTFQYTQYDIFRDDFDGNITNNCAVDIFYHLKVYCASNWLVARVRQLGKLHYYRLDFQLRLINCQNETLGARDFLIYEQFIGKERLKLSQIKLAKHNLVVSDFRQIYKVKFMVQSYINLYMKEEKTQYQIALSIIILISNPSQQNSDLLDLLSKELYSSQPISAVGFKLYKIQIIDEDKFEKLKCENFIQECIEDQKPVMNIEIARFYAKQIIEKNTAKFKTVNNAEEFVTQFIWRHEQERSKRDARNRVKIHLQNVRNQ